MAGTVPTTESARARPPGTSPPPAARNVVPSCRSSTPSWPSTAGSATRHHRGHRGRAQPQPGRRPRGRQLLSRFPAHSPPAHRVQVLPRRGLPGGRRAAFSVPRRRPGSLLAATSRSARSSAWAIAAGTVGCPRRNTGRAPDPGASRHGRGRVDGMTTVWVPCDAALAPSAPTRSPGLRRRGCHRPPQRLAPGCSNSNRSSRSRPTPAGSVMPRCDPSTPATSSPATTSTSVSSRDHPWLAGQHRVTFTRVGRHEPTDLAACHRSDGGTRAWSGPHPRPRRRRRRGHHLGPAWTRRGRLPHGHQRGRPSAGRE